jgi:hypothetical protein
MKIEIKQTKTPDIIQITTLDERWYQKINDKGITVPNIFVPSVTWIAGYYPKGIAFYKWLADKGWNEAETIKEDAGDHGTRTHAMIDDLLSGQKIKMDSFYSDSSGEQTEITVDDWEALMSYVSWFHSVNIKVLRKEFVVYSEAGNFAGTVDLLCEINGEIWLIDYKTSAYIWPSHKLQISAYKKALEENGQKVDKLGILQVGYKKNRAGFKMNEMEDCYDLFESAKRIWYEENKNISPKQKDYPLVL